MTASIIHEISAWSGKPEDEMPLCGANKDDTFLDRTVFTDYVTCAECIEMRARWAALHDGLLE